MTKFQVPNNFQIPNFKQFGTWLLVLGACLVLGAWYLVIPAYGQTFSLGIYPPLLEVMIQPGKSVTQVYKVKNSGENLVLTPQIVPFQPTDELGNIKLPITNYQLPITNKNWFSLTNSYRSLGQPFSLPSGRTEELVLRIKVPENAEEQDHYFSFILTTSPTPPIGQTKTGMKGVIASNILLTISKEGQPRKLAEIEEFSTKNHWSLVIGHWSFYIFDSFDQPIFTVKIRNVGPSFFKPIGKISVRNRTLNLLPENILVNSTRQIRCQIGDKVTPCQFEPRFLMGRYKAELNFKVNGENYQQETIFWALPIKLTLAFLTMAVLLFTMKSVLKSANI